MRLKVETKKIFEALANSAFTAAIENVQVGAATDQEIQMVDVGEDSDEDKLARDRLLGVVGSHNLVGTYYTIRFYMSVRVMLV